MKLLGLPNSAQSLNSMNLKKILLASMAIGTTLTALEFSMPTMPVSANSVQSTQIATATLEGLYVDMDWSVNIYRHNGKYIYQGRNIRTGSTLTLSGATATKSKGQHTYTWNNKGTKYRVIWKTNDRSNIQLQVIDTSRRVLLDRSLQWQNAADFL